MKALEATIEAWRTSRDPELAALVAILSDRILAPRKSEGKGIRDPEKWLTAAKDPPADLIGRLAPTLFAAKQLEAKKRFESIQDWKPDPRVARALEAGLLTDLEVVSSRPASAVRAAFEAAAKRQPLTRLELPEARA